MSKWVSMRDYGALQNPPKSREAVASLLKRGMFKKKGSTRSTKINGVVRAVEILAGTKWPSREYRKSGEIEVSGKASVKSLGK